VPEPPTGIQTTILSENVIVSWQEQADNGSQLTAYKIYFRQAVNNYAEEPVYCDGTIDSDIVTNNVCTVPML
jgi:hypothetical protein